LFETEARAQNWSLSEIFGSLISRDMDRFPATIVNPDAEFYLSRATPQSRASKLTQGLSHS